MTRSDRPRPKLRVTLLTSVPSRPHATQSELGTIDRDDEERTGESELDDCFGFGAVERDTVDNELCFVRPSVALSFNDLAREDDVFEVEYREIVIVKFFGSVEGNCVVQ